MTDLYALLRAELAEKAGMLLGTDIAPAQIDCVATEYPARSAAPLAAGADAAEWGVCPAKRRGDVYADGACRWYNRWNTAAGTCYSGLRTRFTLRRSGALLDDLPRVGGPRNSFL